MGYDRSKAGFFCTPFFLFPFWKNTRLRQWRCRVWLVFPKIMWSTFFVHFSTVQMSSSSHNNYLLNGSFSCYAEGNKGLLQLKFHVHIMHYSGYYENSTTKKDDDFCKTTKQPSTIWKSSAAEILFAAASCCHARSKPL